jgi:hypothetical protein
MMEDSGSRFNAEREVRREVITDMKQVYYRGRYWAATAWSKVGNTSVRDSEQGTEAKARAKAIGGPRRETRSSVKSTA